MQEIYIFAQCAKPTTTTCPTKCRLRQLAIMLRLAKIHCVSRDLEHTPLPSLVTNEIDLTLKRPIEKIAAAP